MNITNLEATSSLFGLMPHDMVTLKRRIEKWNGLVRIFVHPMYEKWRWPADLYTNTLHYKEYFKIEKGLAKLLTMNEDSTPPIIIMEEWKYMAHLQQWLTALVSNRGQQVYVIPTVLNNPTPTIADNYESA